MSNEQIHELIQALNDKTSSRLFLRPISKEVDWAIYFMQGPEKGKRCPREFTPNFYFIKDNAGQYIGAVEDKGVSDLHWYILPEHRKRGYLTTAMQNSIFPHIQAKYRRDVQRISIDKALADFTSSERVALALGFKRVDEQKESFVYEKVLDEYNSVAYPGNDVPLSDDRKKQIINTIGSITATLDLLRAEIEMSHGQVDEVDEISNVANMMDGVYWLLSDNWQTYGED